MNPGGLSQRALLETIATLVEDRLRVARQGPNPVASRLVLFPKRVHEMGLREGRTPDGLSAAYVRLAAELNAAVAGVEPGAGAADRLLGSVEQVVATSVIHERRLVALLQSLAADDVAP